MSRILPRPGWYRLSLAPVLVAVAGPRFLCWLPLCASLGKLLFRRRLIFTGLFVLLPSEGSVFSVCVAEQSVQGGPEQRPWGQELEAGVGRYWPSVPFVTHLSATPPAPGILHTSPQAPWAFPR